MSDFAFRMSSKDRKVAMGEKENPSDDIYDPEGDEYPDPLSSPDSFIQQLLQDFNSARRNEEFEIEDIDELEGAVMDFLITCSDPELGEEDLPGTGIIIDILNNQERNNGISTFGKKHIAVVPLAYAASVFGPQLVRAGAGKLMPYVKKGLQAVGLSQALQNVPIIGDMFGGGGGQEQPSQPIQTMNTTAEGYVGHNMASNRYEMPFDHISDNLMFEAASGIKKKDSDIESLRAQVNSALTQWAKSGEVIENRAVWWALYSYAHEAETIAELASILTAVPEEYHNAVLNAPVGLDEQAPEPGNTGFPEPAEPEEALSPSNTSMSPVPIDGVGTPPKMPQNQTLIPGAVAASHDSLRVKPVFASVDESIFVNYAEEDRQILSRVAAFINAGTHESDIIDTLYPSYGHEYVIWAVEQAKKVANNDPMVDPSIVNLGIEWKEAANDPHDLPEGMHQMDIMEVLEDVKREKKEKERKNNKFPDKGEKVGPNEDQKINQQETSGMITPEQEKTAAQTMNTELQQDEDALQVEPTVYLSRKLSYPYGFLFKMIADDGNYPAAFESIQKIDYFLDDYISNYMESAVENVMNSEKVLEDMMAMLPENLRGMVDMEDIQNQLYSMGEQQINAVNTLKSINSALVESIGYINNWISDDPSVVFEPQRLMEVLEQNQVSPEEWNSVNQQLLEVIHNVMTRLSEPILDEPGFTAADEQKAFRHFQDTREYVDPRYILEPEDYELNERDRLMLNQMGMDFPRQSTVKEGDFTSMPNSFLAEIPAPYSAAYNQTMGLVQQSANPVETQQAYQAGSDATPDPGVFGQLQQQQIEDEQLQEMYPNVPTDMTRQWLQRQQQQQTSPGHPTQMAEQPSSAGQVATNAAQQLPSATTSKVAAWKDVEGNLLAKGQLYKMTSSDYEVPDFVRVVNNGTKLDLYIPRGDMDLSLTESEIKQSNYKFEPVVEKESFFLSESTLSTNEQRALIDEDGTARNMDRLNLEGTHYPPLVQTSKNDKIDLEQIPLQDFFVEDLDLFI